MTNEEYQALVKEIKSADGYVRIIDRQTVPDVPIMKSGRRAFRTGDQVLTVEVMQEGQKTREVWEIDGKVRPLKKIKHGIDAWDEKDGMVEGDSDEGARQMHCQECHRQVSQNKIVYGAKEQWMPLKYYCRDCAKKLGIVEMEDFAKGHGFLW